MINYFNILKIMDYENVTDEEVKQKYENEMNRQLSFKKEFEERLNTTEDDAKLRAINKQLRFVNEYIKQLQEAYSAIGTENMRKQYIYERQKEIINKKVLASSKKLSALVKKVNETSRIDTKSILEEINENVAKKYSEGEESQIGEE